MRKFLLCFIIGITAKFGFCQRNVVYEILPGSERNVIAISDTLWVINRADVLALYDADDEKLKWREEYVKLRQSNYSVASELLEKQKTIADLQAAVAECKNRSKTTEEYLQTLTIVAEQGRVDLKKARLVRNVSLAGAGIAIVLLLLL